MYKLILGITLAALILGCNSPTITKEAAQVAFHTQFSQLLDGCERLGPVKVEYETQPDLNKIENQSQAKIDMRQMAYDNYGADNVVFINSETIDGGFDMSDTIYAQGVAFKCDY